MKTIKGLCKALRVATATAVCAGVGVGMVAQAASITGTISFTGGAQLNGTLDAATAFTAFFSPYGGSNPVVLGGSQTGDYANIAGGTTANFTPFSFGGNTLSPNPVTLWSITDGNGVTYTFDATSVIVDTATRTSDFLNVYGSGVAYISAPGYDPTPGTWSITDTQQGNPVFYFGASTAVATPPAVPDGGTTVLMLGAGLVALTFLRKRFA